MKIKCVKYINSDGAETNTSAWLNIGKNYHVMGIYIDPNCVKYFQLISNDVDPGFATMGYHHAAAFEIVTTSLPVNWHVKIYLNGAINISPKSWQVDGFMEDFYNRDPLANEIFEFEKQKIIEAD